MENRPNNNSASALNEGNDTLATAVETFLTGGPGRFFGRGIIGDNPNFGPFRDVDLFKFELNQSERVRVDIDAQVINSGLDSVLRIFDEAGNQLAVNDDSDSLDSFIRFQAPSSGTYYVGVSSFANFDYRPTVANSGSEAFSRGEYSLEIVAIAPTVEDVVGTEGDDVINGQRQSERIRGLAGDDIIRALGGDDEIFGDAGNDFIDGGPGNDQASGGVGRDRILGGNGNDDLEGGGGDDDIFAGSGNDTVDGDSGQDLIDGQDGEDVISGGSSNDRLLGGGGADTLMGNSGQDRLIGGLGSDSLIGGLGNDSLNGGRGLDVLIGVDPTRRGGLVGFGAGEVDTLSGKGGRDTFVLGDAEQVYYDDGNAMSAGSADLAIITDFDFRQDSILLNGSADQYRLEFSGSGRRTNATLLFEGGDNSVSEVIATLENVSAHINLNGRGFLYV